MRRLRRGPILGLLALAVALAVVVVVVVELHGSGGGGVAPPSRTAARITGWLHTTRGRIVNAAGKQVRLLGLDEPSLIAGEGNNQQTAPDSCGAGWQSVPESEYSNFERFGFNSVRLGLSWANLEPQPPTQAAGRLQHNWNQAYLSALDAEVRGFTSHGIAVVLDMHGNNSSPAFKNPKPDRCQGSGLPVWLYPDAGTITAHRGECDFLTDHSEPGAPIDAQQGYSTVWNMVAGRYAGNRMVVAADMYNEPSSHCPGLALDTFYTRVGTAIRAADPHLLLIYQDNTARRGTFAINRPLTLPGSVYSFHVYAPSWAQARTTLEAHLAHVASWNTPVWLGELGVSKGKGKSGGGDISAALGAFPSVLAPFMSFCRQHDIGWAFHQYAGGGTSLLDSQTGHPRTTWLSGLQAGF